MLTRRGLFTFGASFLAAPAIVRASSLMPVKAISVIEPRFIPPPSGPTVVYLPSAAMNAGHHYMINAGVFDALTILAPGRPPRIVKAGESITIDPSSEFGNIDVFIAELSKP